MHNVEVTIPPVTHEEYHSPNVKMLKYAQKLNKPETQAATEARILKILDSLDLEPLSEEERNHVIKIVTKFTNQFHLPDDPISFMDLIQHKINTNGALPVNIKQFRHPPNIRDEIQRQVKELLEKDIIQESESPYNSPVFLVPKKTGPDDKKKMRLVLDYRKLNEQTVSDVFPLPHITEILEQLGRAKYFTTLDINSGFHQIPMAPEDCEKTAFSTPYGKF